jgi:hypothetical protein
MVAIQKTEPEAGERGPLIGVTMDWYTAVGLAAILHKVAKGLRANDPKSPEADCLTALAKAYAEACASAVKGNG